MPLAYPLSSDAADRNRKIFRMLLFSSILIYFLAQLFFLINIQFPSTPNFDEFHYIPSAKQFLKLVENQNWEHPPLGKEIMAIGIGLLGDQPIGWRFMSTVFGALTLVGMYLWGWTLFRTQALALFVVALTLVNQLLYVQSRIGMLDTFMEAFLVWALAAFSATWIPDLDRKTVFRLSVFSGLLFGLAAACKWAAVIPWLLCIGLTLIIKLFQFWQTRFLKPNLWSERYDDLNWYSEKLLNGFGLGKGLLAWVAAPLCSYFITFIPFLFIAHTPAYTVFDFFKMQATMYDGQLRVVNSHPYMSEWKGWPFLARPIWYAFDRATGSSIVRGVILLGNPVIMWSGLVALLVCAWGWFYRQSRSAFLILVFYSGLYFCWAIIPRKISFYYYYYPAGMVLSLALAFAFQTLQREVSEKLTWAKWVFAGIALGMFIYFFPILAALKIQGDSFRKWMWFARWV